ncbi:hypothetical protein ANTRET_LOCUS10640 [Anthophora retusa]
MALFCDDELKLYTTFRWKTRGVMSHLSVSAGERNFPPFHGIYCLQLLFRFATHRREMHCLVENSRESLFCNRPSSLRILTVKFKSSSLRYDANRETGKDIKRASLLRK